MIDENQQLTESICVRIYEKNHSSIEIGSIVLDAIQPFLHSSPLFISHLQFYSSTIDFMLISEIEDEKLYAQLIRSRQTPSSDDIDQMIFYRVVQKKRLAVLYHSFFDFLLNLSDPNVFIERISSIIENLLFNNDDDPLFQWDKKDCAFQFLIGLIEKSSTIQCPSWLNQSFLERLMETFVQHTNEYIQSNLISLFASLVNFNFLSPFDNYLTSNFIRLTDYSLADVVRRSLARSWSIVWRKSNENLLDSYRFSFGSNISQQILITTIVEQLSRLIGEGGTETELECLRLIKAMNIKDASLDQILDFLVHDGSSDQIKNEARLYLGHTMDQSSDFILDEEFRAILHWLENPAEHLTLDCD